jgi:hypothetical protein
MKWELLCSSTKCDLEKYGIVFILVLQILKMWTNCQIELKIILNEVHNDM